MAILYHYFNGLARSFSRRSFDVQVLRENVYMAHEAETILCVTY